MSHCLQRWTLSVYKLTKPRILTIVIIQFAELQSFLKISHTKLGKRVRGLLTLTLNQNLGRVGDASVKAPGGSEIKSL